MQSQGGSEGRVRRPAKQLAKIWVQRLGIEQWLKAAFVDGQRVGERLKFLIQGEPPPSSAIVLAASGRSGSTWLADILSHATGVQQIFEPLHPRFGRDVRSLTGWDGDEPYMRTRYLPPTGSYPQWDDFWRQVLSGRIRSYWTDQRRTSLLPDRFLVKVIRANLMLGYVHDVFKPKIVYLVRHPCAVVHSRLRVKWCADVQGILEQEDLVSDHLGPWQEEIAQVRDPVGAHAVQWAVENLVPMRELATRSHRKVFYETLFLEPEAQMERLSSFLELSDIALSQKRVLRSSRTSSYDSSHSKMDHLASWKVGLERDEQRRILDWAERLGLQWYSDALTPIHSLESE